MDRGRSFTHEQTVASVASSEDFSSPSTSRPAVMKCLCSLHVIFIMVLLFCVASSTAVAWAVNVITASHDAASLASAQANALVQLSKKVILTELQDSLLFSRVDYRWFNVTPNATATWEFLRDSVIPRLIVRHLSRPSCYVSMVGTSGNLLAAISVENRSTPSERWFLYTVGSPMSPMNTTVILPDPSGSYTVAQVLPPTSTAYQTVGLPWFTNARLDEALFEPVYYSEASSVPYLLATIAIRKNAPNTTPLVVFANGVRTDEFSEQLRVNLSEGQRLYVVERSGHGYLLASSQGVVSFLVGSRPEPMSPMQSDDLVVRDSAMVLSKLPGGYGMANLRTRLGDGREYFIASDILSGDGLDYVVVQVTPVDDVMHGVNMANRNTIIACSLIVTFDLVVACVLAVVLTRPLNRMKQSMVELSKLTFHPRVRAHRHPISQLDEMETAFMTLYNGVQSFAQYVPLALLRDLIADRQHIGMHMVCRNLTIMFCDLVGFTTLCESTDIKTLLGILTDYFDSISQAVADNRGTIDKYIGDCVMAFWNAPQHVSHHEQLAVSAVLAICEKMRSLRQQVITLIGFPFDCRIGVHTDDVMVGSFGSSVRLAYTCVGAGVTVAARLEPFNKGVGTNALVSEATRRATNGVVYRLVASAKLAEDVPAVWVYEPLCTFTPVGEGLDQLNLDGSVNPLEARPTSTFFCGRMVPCQALADYAELFTEAVQAAEAED
eukprot:RCo051588